MRRNHNAFATAARLAVVAAFVGTGTSFASAAAPAPPALPSIPRHPTRTPPRRGRRRAGRLRPPHALGPRVVPLRRGCVRRPGHGPVDSRHGLRETSRAGGAGGAGGASGPRAGALQGRVGPGTVRLAHVADPAHARLRQRRRRGGRLLRRRRLLPQRGRGRLLDRPAGQLRRRRRLRPVRPLVLPGLGRFAAYADGGAGVVIADKAVPECGTDFNFTPRGGVGRQLPPGRQPLPDGRRAATGTCPTPASTASPATPAIDSVQYYGGVMFTF